MPGEPAPLSAGTEPTLRLLAVTDDVAALRAAGAEVSTVAGQVAVFEIPLSRVEALNEVPGLKSVTFPMPLRPSLDVSVPEIHATQVHGAAIPPYAGFTGNGVVVGIIDTGVDVAHDDFKNDDGTTRISYIWDQTDGVGPSPGAPYTYGTQWTAATINSGQVREKDNDGHGTHVTGITAGNGRATGNGQPQYTYIGVAPEAEIMVCKTTFFTDEVIDAVKWMQNRAGSKPCVINLSLGGQMGPHDGTDPFDLALAGLSGPGRIIVGAVGNDGGSGIHAEGTVPGSGTLNFHFSIPNYTPTSGQDVVLLDAWYPGTGNLTTTLVSPNSHQVSAIATNQDPISGGNDNDSPDGYMFMGQGRYAVNGDRNMEVDLWDRNGLSQPPASGTWTLSCQNQTATATQIDIWIAYSNLSSDVTWSDHVDNAELISSPASSDSVLGVSCYVTKATWTAVNGGNYGYSGNPTLGAIAFFSSPGPLRDGGQKPDISAPGMGIGSSKSANATSPLFTPTNVTLQDGKHVISQGTSQASPHVAGVAALMLEANPSLAMKDIWTRLATSARHDIYTGPGGWTASYGFGKVDALAAVNLIVPVRFLALSADWVDGSAVVSWTLRETEPDARFQVERAPTSSGPFHDVSGPVFGDKELSWTDPSPDATEPWYRVSALLRDGSTERYGPVHLDPVAATVRLWQNAPNPFTSGTVIAYELDRQRPVRLDVVDVSGRLVTTLVDGEQSAGRHEINWDGVDNRGRSSAAGVYFARLTTAVSIQVRRMVLAH